MCRLHHSALISVCAVAAQSTVTGLCPRAVSHIRHRDDAVSHRIPINLSVPVPVYGGRHPAALLLHVHVCLDVCGWPPRVPDADRTAQHQLRSHEVLLRHRLGSACDNHR